MKRMKPSISIVGAGNVAETLAKALFAQGYRVTEIISRRPAKSLAKKVHAKAVELAGAEVRGEIVLLCVSDDAIAEVGTLLAASVLAKKGDWRGKIVLHTSGA